MLICVAPVKDDLRAQAEAAGIDVVLFKDVEVCFAAYGKEKYILLHKSMQKCVCLGQSYTY